MKSKQYKNFIFLSKERIKKGEINSHTQHIHTPVNSNFSNYELYKDYIKSYEIRKLNNLIDHLNNYDNQAKKRNIKVLWAVTVQDIHEELKKIFKNYSITKSWSSSNTIFQEVRIADLFQTEGIQNSSKEQAEILLYQANGIIEETGGVYLEFENIGIIDDFSNQKPVVFFVGIENIFSSFQEIELYRSVYSSSLQNKKFPSYSFMYTPSNGKNNFPVYVIVVDNGRSKILQQPEIRQALSCVQCKVCSKVCPIFEQIDSKPYQHTLNGPISSVIVPHLESKDKFGFLSYACTLCGNCENHCPMNIPITQLIIHNRHTLFSEKKMKQQKIFQFLSNRKKLNMSFSMKQLMARTYLSRDFIKNRKISTFQRKSFNQYWNEQQKAD